jgi:hypothetical protein
MFGIDRCLVYTDYFSKDFLLWDCIKRLVYYTGFWFIQGSVEKIFTVLACSIVTTETFFNKISLVNFTTYDKNSVYNKKKYIKPFTVIKKLFFSKDFLLWDCIKRLVYYTGFWFIQGSVEKIFTVLVKCDVLLIFIYIITERNTNNKKDYSYI